MTGPQQRNRMSPDELRERVRGLWAQGLCVSQIAERVRYSSGYVSKVAGELGLTTREHTRHRYDGIGTTGRVFPRGRSAGAVMT